MTTDYSKMSHQQLYEYVRSGNPQAMTDTARAWQKHADDMQAAVNQLQTNLTAIQTEWQGAAADAYFEQSQNVATTMQTQADDAQATSTAVGNTAGALNWARSNMPSPPSWLEQKAADVDSNWVTGAIGFFATDGSATLASEMAKHDIATKHQKAVDVTTQLAGIYTSAQSQLPSAFTQNKDPDNGQNGTNPPGGGPTPVPIYPGGVPGYGGGLGGTGSAKVPEYNPPMSGSPILATTPPGSGPGATSIQGTGEGLLNTTPGTVPTLGGTGGGGAGGIGGGGGGGLGPFGGLGGGGGGLGGLGGGGLGDTDLGGGAGSGIGADDGGLSGTDGTGTGVGADDAAGAGAAGAGEEGESPMGMGMGGMGGAHGAGGGEERGNRANYLRQDKDYWYGDKEAAPPGGVIE